MNPKIIKRFLFAFLALLFAAALLVLVMNVTFFNVTEIVVSFSGETSSILPDTERIISGFYGENLIKISKHSIVRKLLEQKTVNSAEVKKYFPSKLMIDIEYKPYVFRTETLVDNQTVCYLVLENEMTEVSKQTFSFFQKLPLVELNDDYANRLCNEGFDNGFRQVVSMLSDIGFQSLISVIKYDNNKGKQFGKLTIEFSSGNLTLTVKDPVTSDRLNEAVDYILKEPNPLEYSEYDLYAAELVRRI